MRVPDLEEMVRDAERAAYERAEKTRFAPEWRIVLDDINKMAQDLPLFVEWLVGAVAGATIGYPDVREKMFQQLREAGVTPQGTPGSLYYDWLALRNAIKVFIQVDPDEVVS